MSATWTELLVTLVVGVLIPAVLRWRGISVPVITPPPAAVQPGQPAPGQGLNLDGLLADLARAVIQRQQVQPAPQLHPVDAEKMGLLRQLLASHLGPPPPPPTGPAVA